MKKNGFVFVETIIVTAILLASLMLVYSLFISNKNSEDKRMRYDDTAKLYETYYLKQYFDSFDLSSITDKISSDMPYQFIYRGQSEIFGNQATNESKFFSDLWEGLGISSIVVLPYDLTEIMKCQGRANDICSNKDLFAYLNTLDSSLADDSSTRYRMIVEYSSKLDGSACNDSSSDTCFRFFANIDFSPIKKPFSFTTAATGETDSSGCTYTMEYDDFGNLRYVGSNPCNYVTFNDETAGWRIIGVFDNQIKLIRNESIGGYSWDTSASNINSGRGINQWGESGTYTGADLMKLLNPGYEENLAEDASGNEIAGTYVNNSLYWNKGSGNCYNGQNNAYTTCDFSTTGLSENAKSMIDKHTWNLGASTRSQLTKSFYELERRNITGKTCTSGTYCNDTVNRTTTWEGYVGLMYPSDYGYAVGGEARENCLANTNLFNYNTNNCYVNDWLSRPTNTEQRTMSPYESSADVVFIVLLGYATNLATHYDYAVRPTLFLKSNVEISGGTGSATNPYTLKMS